jgi:drug/metabolite transporter, DME family
MYRKSLLREPIRRSDFLYMLAMGAGMAACFAGSQEAAATSPNPAQGNLLAVGSGMSYALMLVGLRYLARRGEESGALATVALGNLMAFLVALPMALPVENWTATNAGVLLYLAVVQIGVAYACLTTAIRHVPVFEATTLLMIEPALSPVWTWLVHGERPGAWPLVGGAIILSATIVQTGRGIMRQESCAP